MRSDWKESKSRVLVMVGVILGVKTSTDVTINRCDNSDRNVKKSRPFHS